MQTVKNLERLWEGLGTPPGGEPFSARDTILLDDSALKAHMQPYNHLIVPEYDAKMRRADLSAIDRARKHASSGVEELVQAGPSVDQGAHEPCVDQTLLAVVGILDELAMQDNVCSWVRAGGISAGSSTITKTETQIVEVPQEPSGAFGVAWG